MARAAEYDRHGSEHHAEAFNLNAEARDHPWCSSEDNGRATTDNSRPSYMNAGARENIPQAAHIKAEAKANTSQPTDINTDAAEDPRYAAYINAEVAKDIQ